jgi:molybdopterin/thiamine biosynthesis adenylyltransferase
MNDASDSVSDAIREAIDHLRSAGVCEVVGGLAKVRKGLFRITCRFVVSTTNLNGLPEELDLDVHIPEHFPFGKIEVYPAENGGQPFGFPHQDSATGKLCLLRKDDAPFDVTRLSVYADWTAQWLADAAAGTLLANGDPYELPDFSTKATKSDLLNHRFRLLIDETENTFVRWDSHIRDWGIVNLQGVAGRSSVFATHFFDRSENLIRKTTFTSNALTSRARMLRTTWALLPNLVVNRHRPPQSFGELRAVFARSNISLRQVLKAAWSKAGDRPASSILLGMPLPRRVGQEPVEIHWQPMIIPSPKSSRGSASKALKKKIASDALFAHEWRHGAFRDAAPVVWGWSENASEERQFLRGSHPGSLRAMEVSIVGCGAIGSPIAESFARGGVQNMHLFDSQVVEYGNLCRHTLDGRHTGFGKADALAFRLATSSPTSQIVGYLKEVPFTPIDKADRLAAAALSRSSLLIDCSTDTGAFNWLSRQARTHGQRLASVFIDANATTLTLILSGKHTSGEKVFRKLMSDIAEGSTPICSSDYFSDLNEDTMVLPVGCWQPTFPGLNAHIWLLAYSAVEHLSDWTTKRWGCDGFGIIIRRNPVGSLGPTIETVWNEAYR